MVNSPLLAQISYKLQYIFQPSVLKVEEESSSHIGHAGSPGGIGTHFRITLVCQAFAGQSRIARHRQVYEALHQELAAGIHALALDLKAPGEEG